MLWLTLRNSLVNSLVTQNIWCYRWVCINWCHRNWVQLLIIVMSVYIAWHKGLKLSLGSISMSRQCSSFSSLFKKFNTWPWTKNVMYYVTIMSVSKSECSLKYRFIADWCLACQMWPDVIRHMWITGKYMDSDRETLYFKVGLYTYICALSLK